MVQEHHDPHRPSDRLPWSDPTIARLVANLQDEIRSERRQAKLDLRRSELPNPGAAVADLEPPQPLAEEGLDWRDQPRWTWPQRN